MKRYILPALCVALAGISPAATALSPSQVKWCQKTAGDFPARQASIQKDNTTRQELAAAAELAGEEWENAEALRNLGPDNAAAADAAKEVYESAKAAFYELDESVTSRAVSLNADFEKFNKVCVS